MAARVERGTAWRTTRLAALLLIPFLLTAGGMLYLFPADTERLFAWPIKPALTALVMGGGYFSGVYYFTRVARAGSWRSVAAGFLPIGAFAWLLLAATLLHWERFTRDHISFYAWFGLYLLTPLLVPALWFANRRQSGATTGDGPRLSRPAAAVFAGTGCFQAAMGLLLFLLPQTFIPIWFWPLTPLTARVLGAWFVLAGLSNLSIGLKREWDRVRLVLETQLLAEGLILLAIPRALPDFTAGAAAAALTFFGFLCLFAWGGLVYLYMQYSLRTRPAVER